MTIKRLSLTAFFIILTLSIGLVSMNLPFTVMAQNNALSQDSDGDGEQETEQLQSSTQNGQIVSGDKSIASGNNILCQEGYNSNEVEDDLPSQSESCLSNIPAGQFPSIDQNILTIVAHSLGGSGSSKITLTDENDGSSITYDFIDRESRSFVIPIGHHYEVKVGPVFTEDLLLFTGDCRVVGDERTSCKGVMQNQQQRVVIALALGPN